MGQHESIRHYARAPQSFTHPLHAWGSLPHPPHRPDSIGTWRHLSFARRWYADAAETAWPDASHRPTFKEVYDVAKSGIRLLNAKTRADSRNAYNLKVSLLLLLLLLR